MKNTINKKIPCDRQQNFKIIEFRGNLIPKNAPTKII